MRNLLVIPALLLAFSSWAQHVITGVVRDAEGPLPLVEVSVKEIELKTTTSTDGSFRLEVSEAGTYTLVFRAMGYHQKEVSARTDGTHSLNIVLTVESTMLAGVTVTEGRYAQRPEESTISIDVLKPFLITERAQSDIEQTMQQASGVNVTDGQINIRSGSGWSYGAGTRVLVLLDDMPLISPDAGQAQWSLIPTEAVAQMDVLKGAGSALYGTSAVNGIVNVRTLRPTQVNHTNVRIYQGIYDAPARGELKWWEGIRGWTGTQFSHTRRSGESKQYGWVIAGQAEHSPGFAFGVPDSRGRLLGKFIQDDPESDWEYEVMAMGLWSETGDALLWNGFDQAYIPLDSQATRTNGFDFVVDPKVTYRGGAGIHTLRGRFMAINNNARSEATNYENYSRASFLEYMWKQNWGPVNVVLGASGQYGRSNSEVFGGIHHMRNAAVYVQGDYSPWEWMKLSGGIRYEMTSLDTSLWDQPVARLGLNIGKGPTHFRASYGQGFRFPTMAEVYTRTNVGALQVFPNYELEPESGWSAEAGIRQLFRWKRWSGYVDVAAFMMRYNNMMEFSFGRWAAGSPNPFNDFGFKSINVGATQISGVELTTAGTVNGSDWDLQYMLGLSHMNPEPLEPDEVYAQYAGNNPQDLSYNSTSSNPESGVLKYRYRWLAKADVQFTYGRWGLGSSLRYNDFMANIDQIFVDPLFSQFIPGVQQSRDAQPNGNWIVDVRCFYRVTEEVKVSFIVNNLANQEYYPRPALIGQPRSFVLQLMYNI